MEPEDEFQMNFKKNPERRELLQMGRAITDLRPRRFRSRGCPTPDDASKMNGYKGKAEPLWIYSLPGTGKPFLPGQRQHPVPQVQGLLRYGPGKIYRL